MNCNRTKSLLSAYIDSELTGQEMLTIREHLGRCQSCQSEKDSLLRVKQLLSALPEHAPRTDLALDITMIASQNPVQISAKRFFRTLIPQNEAQPNSLTTLSLYGRRFAMAGVLSLMSVWFIIAPSASESPMVRVAHNHRPLVNKFRNLVSRYDASLGNHMNGLASYNAFGSTPELQQSNMSLNVSSQNQMSTAPIVGAPPFGQNVFLGGYPSSQSSTLNSFVYTGYSVVSH